jgi:hypothetical protein
MKLPAHGLRKAQPHCLKRFAKHLKFSTQSKSASVNYTFPGTGYLRPSEFRRRIPYACQVDFKLQKLSIAWRSSGDEPGLSRPVGPLPQQPTIAR